MPTYQVTTLHQPRTTAGGKSCLAAVYLLRIAEGKNAARFSKAGIVILTEMIGGGDKMRLLLAGKYRSNEIAYRESNPGIGVKFSLSPSAKPGLLSTTIELFR